jgi:hypothetical protein
MEAALVRVVEGNTLLWLANRAERCPSSVRNGASRGVIRSVRRLSQITMTARFIAALLVPNDPDQDTPPRLKPQRIAALP